MSQSVNGYPMLIDPQTAYYVGAILPRFSKFSSITNPAPSQLFVFIDENEVTLDSDIFVLPMTNSSDYGFWPDMPSNRHNQGANLSFADGHVEHWHWAVPMIDTNGPVNLVPIAQGQMPDYTRVAGAMRQILIDWTTPAPGNPR